MDGLIRAVASRLVMLVFAFSASAGTSFAQQPTQAQVNAIRQACRSDYQTYCASVPTGGSAALGCLKENAQSLSAPCQQAVGRSAAPRRPRRGRRRPPPLRAPPRRRRQRQRPRLTEALRHPKGQKHRRGKRSICCAAPAVPIIGPCAAMCRSAAAGSSNACGQTAGPCRARAARRWGPRRGAIDAASETPSPTCMPQKLAVGSGRRSPTCLPGESRNRSQRSPEKSFATRSEGAVENYREPLNSGRTRV